MEILYQICESAKINILTCLMTCHYSTLNTVIFFIPVHVEIICLDWACINKKYANLRTNKISLFHGTYANKLHHNPQMQTRSRKNSWNQRFINLCNCISKSVDFTKKMLIAFLSTFAHYWQLNGSIPNLNQVNHGN